MAEQQLQEKLKEVKAKIKANSKDAHFADALISELVSLQKQADIEPTEIFIPVADVEKSHDFGPAKLSKVKGGKYIFEAKGGMWTIVDIRMQSLYGVCEHIFENYENPNEDKEIQEMEESLRNAMIYSFQTPILCSLDQQMLFEVMAQAIKSFNEYAVRIMPQTATPETEEDVKKNIEFDSVQKAIEAAVNAPIPDVD